PDDEFEFLFIDDGSTDDSMNFLLAARANDSRIELVSFSRNFGSHAAVFAGFENCTGDVGVVFTADGQDPPELIRSMVGNIRNGSDIVWGVRCARAPETMVLRVASQFFYWVVNWITDLKLPPYGVDVVMLSRRARNALRAFRLSRAPYNLTIAWIGFPSSC